MNTKNDKSEGLSTGMVIAGIIIICLLMVIPLVLVPDSEFAGADGLGADTIAQIAPDYNNEWIGNIWEPPGSETESLLFALQAAIGGILLGYVFGFFRGRQSQNDSQPSTKDSF